MLHLDVHPVNPQHRFLSQAAEILKSSDGIGVYPTDTVYGMGACISNAKAINRIAAFIQKDKKRLFSFLCSDFSQISHYAQVSTQQFRLLKRYLPGPFTFLLKTTNYVPKKICKARRVVGIRIPDCPVVIELVKLLEEPLANTSINIQGQFRGDPDSIVPAVLHEVDVMLDIGPLSNPNGSTIVDLTSEDPVVLRQGKGEFEG